MIHAYKSKLSALVRVADAVLITLMLWFCSYIYQDGWSDKVIFAAVCTIAVYYFIAESSDLYRSWRGVSFSKYVALILWVWLPVAAVLLLMGWATKTTESYSRLAMGTWLVLTPLVLILSRLAVFKLLMFCRKRGFNTKSVAIVGSTGVALELIHLIESTPTMGLDIKGIFDDVSEGKGALGINQKTFEVNPISSLSSRVRANNIDIVYIALPFSEEPTIQKVMDELADTTASSYIVPDFFVFNLINMRWSSIGHIGAVSLVESPVIGTSAWAKRAEDLVLGTAILALIIIPMLLIALGIKLTSKGPVLFKQTRFGLDGNNIMVWKFRSMSVCEDGAAIQQATKHDSRVTPLGKFLRKTSLDELPQFLNVLQGSMSIVGPRPHAVSHNEEYRKIISGYMLRHKVKPGITGWAQINGWRGETDELYKMEERVKHDLWYIKHWSIWLDIKIIFKTVFKGFLSRNAY